MWFTSSHSSGYAAVKAALGDIYKSSVYIIATIKLVFNKDRYDDIFSMAEITPWLADLIFKANGISVLQVQVVFIQRQRQVVLT